MNLLGDDVLSKIFQELSWGDRLRLKFVSQYWRSISKSHAAVVWQKLTIDEAAPGLDLDSCYGCMLRWCRAHGCHVHNLDVVVQNPCPTDHSSDEEPMDSNHRPLTDLLGALLASSCQLKRLSISTMEEVYDYVPDKILTSISVVSSLESLTVAIPQYCNLETLASAICSLRKLKVADLMYTGPDWEDLDQGEKIEEQYNGDPARALIIALCSCPLLHTMKLARMYLEQLPAELATASQLTWLRLRDPQAVRLSIAPNALPCSLQRLRLAYDDVTGFLDEHEESVHESTAALPTLPRDFASLHHLQHLQLTVHGWGVHRLPSTLQSLKLEAPMHPLDTCDDAAFFTSISTLLNLEALHFAGLRGVGACPEGVAAALLPLRHLRALLTLLSLRGNRISTLTNALPADAGQNLRVLDVSGNPLGRPPNPLITYWRDANMMALSGSWAQLQVLGIRPPLNLSVTGRLKATADMLRGMLRRQAAAAQPPRRPPAVVFSERHEDRSRPADELAVVA